jgi:TRAP-type mannitol/chloroaromatic compound transport system substrate-binding protein
MPSIPASSTAATALPPIGTGPSFDWNAISFLGWMNYGGGYDLYNELQNQSSDFPLRSR